MILEKSENFNEAGEDKLQPFFKITELTSKQ